MTEEVNATGDTQTPRTERIKEAVGTIKERAGGAYSQSRARAGGVAQRAGESVENAPMAVLVGGLAVGALVGALLPRSERERQALAPVGKRIAGTTAAALAAARDAGREQLNELAPKDAIRNKLSDAIGQVVTAAKESGREAAKAGGTSQA